MTDLIPHEKKPIHHHVKKVADHTKIATSTTTISTPGRPPVTVKNDVVASTAAVEQIVERQVYIFQKLAAVPFWGALKALMIMVFLLTIFVAYESRDKIVAEILRSIDRSTALEHTNALHNYIENHKLVGPVIRTLREETHAGRVVFFQFHNGTSSLKGVPFLFASQTETAVAPGVSDDHEALQRVPISMFIDWLPQFLENECAYDSIETSNSSLRELMIEHGVHAAFACPVYVPGAREPSGFLAVSYLGDVAPTDHALTMAKLRATTTVIGAALVKDSVVEPKVK